MQSEIKRVKAKPLNPDNVRLEKIIELKDERERYKDLYVSESIKNKEFLAIQLGGAGSSIEQHGTYDNRNLHSSQTSKRPMTTISSGSTMRGGFFVTQMGGGG